MTDISRQEADAVATAAVALAKSQATSGGDDAPIADLCTLTRWELGYGPRFVETLEELPSALTPQMAELMKLEDGSYESAWRARLAGEEQVKGTQPEMTAQRKDQHP